MVALAEPAPAPQQPRHDRAPRLASVSRLLLRSSRSRLRAALMTRVRSSEPGSGTEDGCSDSEAGLAGRARDRPSSVDFRSFTGMPPDGKVAPIPDIRGITAEPRSSTEAVEKRVM